MILFTGEYYTNNEIKLNILSIFVYNIQHVVLSLVILAQLTINEKIQMRLYAEPIFWVCAGKILKGLIEIVDNGLNPYLIVNNIDVQRYPWIGQIAPLSDLVLQICYFIAFSLAGIRLRDRLNFRLFKFSK